MKGDILFLGDVSLNNGYDRLAKEGINPFSAIRDEIDSSALVIGNLECLLESSQGENFKKIPRLKTTMRAFRLLLKLKPDFLGLAHNHIADNLEEGVEKTLDFLSVHGIKAFGFKSKIPVKGSEFLSFTHGGRRIAILNYVTADTHPCLPDGFDYIPNIFDIERVREKIQSTKKSHDFLVIYVHWGGRVEGGNYPDWGQNIVAHDLIDAGADLIIGHHPHVVQPMERYKSKHIYYSLGNFCFDDIICDERFHPLTDKRKIGMIVKLNFDDSRYECSEIFIKNDNLRIIPFPAFKSTFRKINFIYKGLAKFRILWELYFIKHSYFDPIMDFFSRKDLSLTLKLRRFFKSLIKRIF